MFDTDKNWEMAVDSPTAETRMENAARMESAVNERGDGERGHFKETAKWVANETCNEVPRKTTLSEQNQ